jgi:hypothetical protein
VRKEGEEGAGRSSKLVVQMVGTGADRRGERESARAR